MSVLDAVHTAWCQGHRLMQAYLQPCCLACSSLWVISIAGNVSRQVWQCFCPVLTFWVGLQQACAVEPVALHSHMCSWVRLALFAAAGSTFPADS